MYLNKTFLTMLASRGNKVVEPLPHHLKVGGSVLPQPLAVAENMVITNCNFQLSSLLGKSENFNSGIF